MPVYKSDITGNNVNKLKLLWKVKTYSYVTARPIYFNNKIFVSDWQGYIYCFNAVTGGLIYEKQLYEPPKQNEFLRKIPLLNKISEPIPYYWNGFAGTGCISDGIWYLASVGGKKGSFRNNGAPGKLYAIKAEAGSLLWESELSSETYSGSLAVPVCNGSNIYAGLASVEEVVYVLDKLLLQHFVPTCVGEVFCFDKSTGRKIWSRKTTSLVKNDNPDAKGASVWGGLSLSENYLYFGTGNSYGKPVSKASDSVICVNASDGKLNWSFQATADDGWLPLNNEGPDYDFGCTPIPFPCKKAESGVCVGAGCKNGNLYALDSKSGKLIWKTTVNIKSSPDDGIRSNITYNKDRIYVWSKNKDPKNTMTVVCVNSENGSVIWNKIIDGINAMTTGAVTNDLFFLSNYSGEIYALDIDNGNKVWSDKIQKAAFGSDIGIYKNRIYTGMGVPAAYGGTNTVYGIACYGIS